MSLEPEEILLSQRFFPEHGGSIRWMYELFRRWPRAVHTICHDYVQLAEKSEILLPNGGFGHVIRADILLEDWGFDSWGSLIRYWRMWGLSSVLCWRKPRARIFVARLIPEGLVGVLLKLLIPGKRTLIAFAHGEELLAYASSGQLRLLLRFIAPRIDLVVANSEATANALLSHVDPGKMVVQHPGVAFADFEPLGVADKFLRREALGILKQSFVLITVGRLDERKNHRRVLEACQRLYSEIPQLRYLIVGDGPLRAELEMFVTENGLTEIVSFLGAVEDSERISLLQVADLFVMPSVAGECDTEGFGMSFIEAAAAGLPSVAGNVGGQSEAVLDGKTGTIVDGQSVAQIEQSIRTYVEQASMLMEHGVNARERAKSLDWSCQVTALMRELESRGF